MKLQRNCIDKAIKEHTKTAARISLGKTWVRTKSSNTVRFEGVDVMQKMFLKVFPLVSALALAGCQMGADDSALAASTDEVLVARTVWVSPDGNDANTGNTTSRPKRTIQAAINVLGQGGTRTGTVRLMPGVYTDVVDIEGYTNLRILGDGRDTVIWRPATTLGWNVSTYGNTRRTPVRIVGSTNITLRSVTLDFETIHGDFVAGVLVWNSSATFNDNIFTNMSAAGYYEFTSYVSAPGATPTTRPKVRFTDNEFMRTGRVGVILHGYVDGELLRNGFRTEDDFGYAIEVASTAIADIRSNDIAGYDTIAETDGSASGGIYIENAFTTAVTGVTKSVIVRSNNVHANGYGLSIGNAFPGYAGDVDIRVQLDSNLIVGNNLAGVSVTDEGRSAGSSVTLIARNNLVANNGAVGYQFSTAGDGEIHATLTGEVISGHEIALDVLADTGASLHDITLRGSNVSDNTAWGVRNFGPSIVSARNVWWGAPDGPTDALGTTEVTYASCAGVAVGARRNIAGDDVGLPGIAVSDGVDYCSWSLVGTP
jgi:hypothetical protein